MAAMNWEEAKAHFGSMGMQDVMQIAERAITHYMWIEPSPVDDSGYDIVPTPKKRGEKVGYCTGCHQWHTLEATPEWAISDIAMAREMANMGDESPEFETTDPWSCWPRKKLKETGKVQHGLKGHCPGCGTTVQYRSLNIGYKSLDERILLMVYRKSLAEENTVCCVGYDVTVPWKNMDRNGPYEPPMDIEAVEACVFRYGRGADRFKPERCELREADERGHYWTTQRWVEWKHMGQCKSGYQPGMGMGGNSTVRTVLDYRSFVDAMEGTGFAKVWNAYGKMIKETGAWDFYDKITVMAKMAKYPCIEYLYKLQYPDMAKYVIDNAAGNVLNLRGKTARSVLRLTETQWGEVKGKKITVTPEVLMVAKYVSNNRIRLGMESCAWIARQQYDGLALIREWKKLRGPDITKTVKYCQRSGTQLRDYRDYLGQMKQLKMDMRDKTLTYPQNFAEMHARLSERITVQADEIAKRELREMMDTLGGYCFSAMGLVMRPFITTGEVVREGTVLHHCVGGYAKSYASGKIVLCCVREETALSKPMYTVEFDKTGRRVQCRGEYNRTREADEERLEQFWRLFDLMRADLAAQQKKEQKRLEAEAKKAERNAA